MARRQIDPLGTPAVEEGVDTYENGVGSFSPKCCERYIDLPDRPRIEDLDLQSDGASRRFDFPQRSFGIGSVGRIDQHGHARGRGHQLAQQLQPFRRQLGAEKIDYCYGRSLSISALSTASIVRYDASTSITRDSASAIPPVWPTRSISAHRSESSRAPRIELVPLIICAARRMLGTSARAAASRSAERTDGV
jgi:hypothetical protein